MKNIRIDRGRLLSQPVCRAVTFAPGATLALAQASEQPPSFWDAAFPAMSEERQKKCAAYLRPGDRERCILADALARRLAADRFEAQPRDVVFSADEEGAPVCESHPAFVSWSHAGDYVAAVCADGPVGVDVELHRSVKNTLVRRVCTPQDLAYIFGGDAAPPSAVTEGEAQKRFFRVWTFKEALGKAIGTGWTEDVIHTSFCEEDAYFYEEAPFCLCVFLRG